MQLKRLNVIKIVDDKNTKLIEELKLKGFIDETQEQKQEQKEPPSVDEEEPPKKITKK